jgi:hypothetical protein
MLEGSVSAELDSRVTGGVIDHGIRLVVGRQSQDELGSEALGHFGQPFGVR